MLVLMFITIVGMLLGIAGMQYLALCEQRRTQFMLSRVQAAIGEFDHRRALVVDEVVMGRPFEQMINTSLINRYGKAA